jgi:hypothetical protein
MAVSMDITIPPRSIFISVGSGLAAHQERLVHEIERWLAIQGYACITLGRNALTNEGPLGIVRELVTSTLGTVVIAFGRLRISDGIEFPEAPHASQIAPRTVCTVWNHMEAAMSFQAGRPLLILAEAGVFREGMLDPAVFPAVSFTLDQPIPPLPPAVQAALEAWLVDLRR